MEDLKMGTDAALGTLTILRELIGPRRDRISILSTCLERNGIPFEILLAGGGRHLRVRGPRPVPGTGRRFRTLTAHYDRHPRSPGANDNGAAVAGILGWLVERYRDLPSDTQVLFTDREEILREERIRHQGAWALGELLRKRGETGSFVHLDAFGRGDRIVLSSTADLILSRKTPRRKPSLARSLWLDSVRRALSVFQPVELATPLSDELALSLHGFPALLVTCLPDAEAQGWKTAKKWPETWKLINTPNDRLNTLTEDSRGLLRKALTALAFPVSV